MCIFRIEVDVCSCRDPDCLQKSDVFGQLESPAIQETGGHISKVHSYTLEGPKCFDFFYNDHPFRPIASWGFANHPNGKQDCKNRIFLIDTTRAVTNVMCKGCKKFCFQPSPPSSPTPGPSGSNAPGNNASSSKASSGKASSSRASGSKASTSKASSNRASGSRA